MWTNVLIATKCMWIATNMQIKTQDIDRKTNMLITTYSMWTANKHAN